MGLSDRLREVRKIFSLGQQAFAQKIGSSQSTVSAFEKGDRKPDVDMIIHICDIFNVNINWLLLGVGSMAREDSPVEPSKISDSRKNKGDICHQLIENNSKENIDTAQNVRLSENLGQQHKGTHAEKVMELQERLLSSQERLLAATEQVAELRLQLERRDMRIHELEKENAGLREAQKVSAALQHDAGWKAG